VWDRLFGTFEREYRDDRDDQGRESLYYGVIPATNSWDPTWVNLQHWYFMFGPQLKWDSWAAPLRHWTPPQGKCPKLGSKLNPYEKYSARPESSLWTTYAVLDAVVMMVFLAVSLNTTILVDCDANPMIGCGTGFADLAMVLCLVTLVLWSASNIGQIFTEESMATLGSESVRQLVLIGAGVAYFGPCQWMLPYLLIRLVLLLVLGSKCHSHRPSRMMIVQNVCPQKELKTHLDQHEWDHHH